MNRIDYQMKEKQITRYENPIKKSLIKYFRKNSLKGASWFISDLLISRTISNNSPMMLSTDARRRRI